MSRSIRLTRVRQNNLKNISVEFPFRKISVITGLSGSGKSSLAFDTLYAEGQRRYIESLSTYTRQFLEKMPKPDLDSIENIPPAIALEQKNHVLNSRSTVGTQTEIIDYLRLLFAKTGKTSCLQCGQEVTRLNAQSILEWAIKWLPGRKAFIVAPIFEKAEKPAKKSKKLKGKREKEVRVKTGGVSKKSTSRSLLEVLQEQGFRRILTLNFPDTYEVIDLEEISNLPSSDRTYVIIDRLRWDGQFDADIRNRILGSIEQALALGQSKVGFFDGTNFKLFNCHFSCIVCGFEHRLPEPQLFSFNSPLGACAHCSGFGHTLNLDESLIVPDPAQTIKNGAIDPFHKPSFSDWEKNLFRFAERHGISIGKRYRDLTSVQKDLLWKGDPGDSTFPGIFACFEELKRWKYKLHIRVFIRRYQSAVLCTHCQGSRLKREALAVKVAEKSIHNVLSFSIIEAIQWFRQTAFPPQDRKIAADIFSQIERRLLFLEEVGVGYLTLSRLTKTLSGGEFQRINLATQLGNGLCGTLYVLDEPSIGLHPADTERLIRILIRLRDQGNSVVIVEHDLEVMKAADWLLELGPGAGHKGGELVAQGTAADLMLTPGSITGKYLAGTFRVKLDREPRPASEKFLVLKGCRENNLKNIHVEFPLERFVVVTGVSGSGKSTLVHKTLFNTLSHFFYRSMPSDAAGRFDQLYGADQIGGVTLLDQTSIGKSSRSNPVTYLKAWDEIRKIYAAQPLSIRRGYTPQFFSFNVDGGRCATCKGEGEITLDMHFMAEIQIPCEDCKGTRFKETILDISYRGKNISQILQTTIDEAYELLRDHPLITKKLGILRDVGLGYLQLGQSSTTLSGGESQRLKIAATLDNRIAHRLLYIFDEPTTGLHLEDIKKLLSVIQDLVDARHSVIMIEHHIDVIAHSDWMIDLGPGGGMKGGTIVAHGPPSQVAQNPDSPTGKALRNALG